MATPDTPLWATRVAVLAITWAWSIIAFGSAINAEVKSKRDKDRVQTLAPQNAVVNIDDSDVFQTGVVITAITIVLFIITSVYLALLLVFPQRLTAKPRIIAFQSATLAFFAFWLFATLVPYTHFIRTHSANVTATIEGIPIDGQLIESLESQFGLTAVYHKIGYLRLVAILPWITLLFTIIASIVTYMAAYRSVAPPSRTPQPLTAEVPTRSSEADASTEKAEEKADAAHSPV